MSIPIANIYYLLCYAWNKLDEKERVAVSADDHSKLLDLLAKVLINSTRILLNRGIDRNYVDVTTEIPGVKGKIEMSQTVKRNLLSQLRTICSFDEFSSNILTNRILITTLNRLIRTDGLDKALKSEIKNLLWRFDDVDWIELSPSIFTNIRLNRNNKFYGFILNVCQLIFERSLLDEQTGKWLFMDFQRDERKMNQLFEAFLRNFYAIEQKVFKVRRENIGWQFSSDEVGDLQFLPLMQTDITLESDDSKIIIDAKYYRETLKTNYGVEKISSANLYQLFSYLLNQRKDDAKSQTATGILIYPTIERDYDFQFCYQKHQIFVKTVNLDTDWRIIEKRLLDIVGLSTGCVVS